MITRVTATRRFEKELRRLPMDMQEKVATWVSLVEEVGIHEVAKRPGFHDEPLKGQRAGQRSIRLNRAYRLIYRVVLDRVLIELLEVNKHEY